MFLLIDKYKNTIDLSHEEYQFIQKILSEKIKGNSFYKDIKEHKTMAELNAEIRQFLK